MWRESEGIEPPKARSIALSSDLKSADATKSSYSPNSVLYQNTIKINKFAKYKF